MLLITLLAKVLLYFSRNVRPLVKRDCRGKFLEFSFLSFLFVFLRAFKN